VRDIIIRDSLSVRDESLVCDALHRWSKRQCRKRGLELSEENVRHLLEGSQYLVRYLTLTLRDFSNCQRATRLLSPEEAKSVVFNLLYRNACLPPQFEQSQSFIARKRFSRRKFPLLKRSFFNNEISKVCMRKIFIFLSCVFD